MVKNNEAFSLLVEAGKNPVEAARQRSRGRRAIGCPLTDVPVELVHAAGLYPVAVLGHRGPAGKGREHLQSFSCSYARGVIDMMLDGTLDFLEGLIIPFICDTTRAIDFILRYVKAVGYLECYRPPKALKGRGARDYTLGEIVRLKESLEKFSGSKITDDRLDESFDLYNKARSELRRLEPMREDDPDSFYAVCKAFMVLPVKEFIELAGKVETPAGAGEGVSLVVAGKVLEPGDLAKTLAALGARIVADDLVTGSRLYTMDLNAGEGRIEALMDRQLNNIPFVGLLQGPVDRADFLLKTVSDTGAAGVLMIAQKFCEPFEIDIPEVREKLKEANIPVLVIETDYEQAVAGALRTRIEAFLEMIRHG